MALQITFEKDDGEKVVVSLDDLSPDTLDRIAHEEKEAGLTFWGVYLNPRETPGILYKVICAAAAHAGIDPPAEADTMAAMFEQSAMFSEGVDIGKQPMTDGLPNPQGGTEVGSSSISPDLPTDGPPASPEESPSAIS